MLQPRSANSTASQSSSSGCVGAFALAAEIVRCSDDPLAKVTLPDAIHHHAGQQRLVRRGQPQRESLAALRNKENALRLVDRRPRIQRREEPGLDLLALLLEIAAQENVRVGNDLFVRQNVGRRIPLGSPQIRFAELLQQRGALRIGGCPPRGGCDGVGVRRIDFLGLRLLLLPAGASPALPRRPPPRHLLEYLRLGQQRKVSGVGLNIEQTDQRNLALHAAGEQRRHAVIIALADRIELMIVAARAADRKSEKRRARPYRPHQPAIPRETGRRSK